MVNEFRNATQEIVKVLQDRGIDLGMTAYYFATGCPDAQTEILCIAFRNGIDTASFYNSGKVL